MHLSRRTFLQTVAIAGAAAPSWSAFAAARGRESLANLPPWQRDAAHAALAPTAIRLSSNENPLGPGERALSAVRSAFGAANRYPFEPEKVAQAAIARAHGIKEEHVLVGCGSGEILRMSVDACVTPSRPLVTGSPTYEDPAHRARTIQTGVIEVPVDRELRLDLERMAQASIGAGLVYVCNPNNPTGSVHGASAISDFIARVGRVSPDTFVLIDEAYHEYVDSSSYRTAVPAALENPQLIVSRTFSKVYGMAGLRIGYALAHPKTIEQLRAHKLGAAVNVLASAAAVAALDDKDRVAAERTRNREVRQFTRDAIARLGYSVAPSDTNFVMVDVRRDVKPIIESCAKAGVLIGRAFPPLTTWARISIGTMEEMQRAIPLVGTVLGAPRSTEQSRR
jgi:histidinol-phosphate aminotransferase